MSDFEYSTDALNTKSLFYRAKIVIYVEGVDDVMFWSTIFSTVPDFKFHIEPLGGSSELDGYIEKIQSGELDAIAARDSDYLIHTKGKTNHERILYTYGYSIENTLYTAESIHALAKIWCKDISLERAVCDEWLESFGNGIRCLLALDIANAATSSGLQVLRDNCSQFMKSKTSQHLCPERINLKAQEIRKALPIEVLATVDEMIDINASDIAVAIRGHFLASAVSRFISKRAQMLGRKVAVSCDALYVTAITQFQMNINAKNDRHGHYVKSALRAAMTC
jgi:hypothetical protein